MAVASIDYKTCRRCNVSRPLGDFYVSFPSLKPRNPCRPCLTQWRYEHRKVRTPPPDLPGEEWRTIPSCLDYYEASSQGRIRRINATNSYIGKILKFYTNKLRYQMVSLSIRGVIRVKLVHRLVAEAFLGICPAGHCVNHQNCEPSDNRPQNLEYVTPKGNTHHAMKLGRIPCGEAHPLSKLNNAKVRAIKARLASGESQTEIAKAFYVSKHTIHLIRKGKIWKSVA